MSGESAPIEAKAEVGGGDLFIAAAIFVAALAGYHANGGILFAGDSPANLAVALSLLHQGEPLLSPTEAPQLFHWAVEHEGKREPVHVAALSAELERRMADGTLVLVGPRYQVVESARPGLYAGTFGVGPAVVALPGLWVSEQLGGPLSLDSERLWYAAKAISAACTAGSAALVYLAARAFCTAWPATVVALAYAFGTCVFSTSSQGLWQHGPNELFLAVGICFLVRGQGRQGAMAAAGAAFGMATICRPTSALVAASVGVYLLFADRRGLAAYVAAGLPFAGLLVAYNSHALGSPLAFGQTRLGEHAIEKTGSAVIFQTPVWRGMAGLLASPSRGLFVFSPFLLAAAWGAARVLAASLSTAAGTERQKLRVLAPLVASVLAIWTVEAMHFDWWGGWSFGYRHIVDTTTILAVLLAPVMKDLLGHWILGGLFTLALAWSIGVQVLGVLAYDLAGWNARRAYLARFPSGEERLIFDEAAAERARASEGASLNPVEADVDQARYRDRLWSWSDSPIPYYLTHFSESRARQRQFAQVFLAPREQRLKSTHDQIAAALQSLKEKKPEAGADAFSPPGSPNPWRLGTNAGDAAELQSLPGEGMRVVFRKPPGKELWDVQLDRRPGPVVKGRQYRLSFRARAPKPRPIAVALSQDHEPWENLGFYQEVNLAPEWKMFHLAATPTSNDERARLQFYLGGSDVPVEIQTVQWSAEGGPP